MRHRVSHGMAYRFSTNFDDSASLLAETRTRSLHPAQSMAQGLLLRKDMPRALSVGAKEDTERQSCLLQCRREIGTVTAPNIIRAKQATQKELCASLMPGRAGAASIMSIIGTRPGREASISIIGGSFLRAKASRNGGRPRRENAAPGV